MGSEPTLYFVKGEEANVLLGIHKPLVGATRNGVLGVEEVA